MERDYLILKRASASRPSGEWKDDDFDVLANGKVAPIDAARWLGVPVNVIGLLAGLPADFGKLIAEETDKWAQVIRTANIKPD
jgi:hypothetical protein